MKTNSILIASLLILSFINFSVQAQFRVKDAGQPIYNPSALLNAYPSSSTTQKTETDYNSFKLREMEPATTPAKNTAQTTRVMGYYKAGYGANAEWKSMSLKVIVETDRYGRDEIKVTEYKTGDYWTTIPYTAPSKAYGDIAKEYSYYLFIGANQVYFNI